MKYTVNIYEVSTEKDKKLRAFATVTFGDSFKVTGITIREGKTKLTSPMGRKILTIMFK